MKKNGKVEPRRTLFARKVESVSGKSKRDSQRTIRDALIEVACKGKESNDIRGVMWGESIIIMIIMIMIWYIYSVLIHCSLVLEYKPVPNQWLCCVFTIQPFFTFQKSNKFEGRRTTDRPSFSQALSPSLRYPLPWWWRRKTLSPLLCNNSM